MAPGAAPELVLLHRDARLAAFAKPSGLLVHRGWDDDPVVALDLARRAIGAHVFPVHRLDRGTSGVLLFALDAECAAALGRLFEGGAVRKTYLALVRGVAPDAGVIDHPVPRDEHRGAERVPAVTEYRRRFATEPLDPEGRAYSLVEAHPRTGRLHQIRRHLKHIAHPVVGDANYGKGAINRFFRERFGLERLALHARELAFDHPFTGEAIRFVAPLPEDLRAPFARMGIGDALTST